MNLTDKNKDAYCPVPWREQMIESNGAIRLCCLAQDTIKNDDGTEANVATDSLDKIWNNKHMQEIRQSMIDGVKDDMCKACYQHEANNGYSNRENELEEYLTFKSEYSSDIIVDEKPNYYDVRFGNLCNMKCITCGPQYSSEHYEEYIKIHEDLKVETNNNIVKIDEEMTKLGEYCHVGRIMTSDEMDLIKEEKENYEWPENDSIFNNILEQINKSNIIKLYITGGEPTISAANKRLLKELVDSGKSQNITLWLNTNMTNVNEAFYNLVAQFKHVRLMMSIDGIGDTFEYIRYPGQWKQIDKNIHKLIDFVNNVAPQKFDLQLAPVIQLLNLLNLEDIIEYFIKIVNSADCDVTFCPNVLRGPDYYRIINANYNIKQEINEKIQAKYKNFMYYGFPKLQHILQIIDNTLTYKNEEDPSLMNIVYENHKMYKKYRKIDHLDDWFYASMKRLI
jgi:MoaA/NifB/PqqE/SkfB family radical SAM enzyme